MCRRKLETIAWDRIRSLSGMPTRNIERPILECVKTDQMRLINGEFIGY